MSRASPSATLESVLTIAGSDSSGGAGIQADLRTFAALQVHGCSAITAVTAQNTQGVRSVLALPPSLVAEQIDAVLDDIRVATIKIGMLANAAIVVAVAKELAKTAVPVVLDPVMVAKGGSALLEEDAVAALKAQLLPRATLVTPNLPEAERLVGFPVRTVAEQEQAAKALCAAGAGACLVKGGHAYGDPVDVLCDGKETLHYKATRMRTRNTHGTGCTLASAIAARMARGRTLVQAVQDAHTYVQEAIRQAPDIGRGNGPIHQMHLWYRAG
ncbi:MAG: bifunctional hydroxymethylpyrimidine kinase/phosphomethylpyrimidine kinase [Deltaproteobacteria bacterium]|nr:bifunctional hydroxymethylpyrimidine kinase/phosphomethylpyrimidine kinase [Deltaproteobacteria bacterium]